MMLKEENIMDEWLSYHSQSVFYSLSMTLDPNNFSDSLSNAASQSSSQKIQVYSFTKQVTMGLGSCCEEGKTYVSLQISVQLLFARPPLLSFQELMPAQITLLHDQPDW